MVIWRSVACVKLERIFDHRSMAVFCFVFVTWEYTLAGSNMISCLTCFRKYIFYLNRPFKQTNYLYSLCTKHSKNWFMPANSFLILYLFTQNKVQGRALLKEAVVRAYKVGVRCPVYMTFQQVNTGPISTQI